MSAAVYQKSEENHVSALPTVEYHKEDVDYEFTNGFSMKRSSIPKRILKILHAPAQPPAAAVDDPQKIPEDTPRTNAATCRKSREDHLF